MKIAIGSDHAGFEHKLEIIKFLENTNGTEILDVGPFNKNSVDYPDYAHLLAKEVLVGSDFGILICSKPSKSLYLLSMSVFCASVIDATSNIYGLSQSSSK